MSFLINPYAFLAAGGDYESIATISVGSGGASSIEFTSIPGTYQHLQVRMIARGTDSSQAVDVQCRVGNGSVDTGTNYADHVLYGNGSGAFASAYTSKAQMEWLTTFPAATAISSAYGPAVIDFLDYAATTKYKTVRAFGGRENNGAGTSVIASGLWMSTSAIDTLRLFPNLGNFAQHTTAALYGIKAP